MNKNIVIIILSIIIVSLSGYIVYDKIISKEENKTTINSNESKPKQEENDDFEEEKNNLNTNNNISSENIDNNSQNNEKNTEQIENINIEKYEDIITNDLFKLLGQPSLKELSNQDKLSIVFEMYKNKYGWKKTINKTELLSLHSDSVIRNMEINYTNLSDYSMTTNYTDTPLYNYNSSTGIYTYANTGHQTNNIEIINKELIDYSNKDNEISLSYKFVFIQTSIRNNGYHKLYYTIEDITKNKEFKSYSYQDVSEEIGKSLTLEEAKTYVKENYNEIKENLYTYTFVFKKDNNIILEDYYRE